MEAAFGSECREVEVPIEIGACCVEDEVETTLNGFEFRGGTGVNNFVGAHLPGFVGFGGRGGEGGHFAAPLIEKRQGHVTQATDADDSDAVSGFHVELDDGVEDGASSAEEGACFGQVDTRWDRGRPSPVTANLGGEAAGAAQNSPFDVRAKVVIAA